MGKKKKKTDATTDPDAIEAALTDMTPAYEGYEVLDTAPDPAASFVLDLGGGTFDIVPCRPDVARVFRREYGGGNWEHVSEDRMGRWVYRAC